MLSPRYEQPLWNRALRRAFPEFARIKKRKPTRNEIAQRFDYIRVFRNRIAHHEPIFTRALANDYKSLLEAASGCTRIWQNGRRGSQPRVSR